MTNEEYIKYEIQQGIQEWKISDLYTRIEVLDKKIDSKFEKLDHKFDSKFNWLYGIMIAGIILSKFIHWMGW